MITKMTINGAEYLVSGDYPHGDYTKVLAHGWTQNQDGTWTPPGIPSQTGLKTLYSHRDFILRIGDKYAAIERLKDENNLLPPDQKNYDLSRLFQLWDKSDVIDLGDADLHAAFAAFVTLGIMSQADADAIMTPNEQA